jgi:hypothetical protein
VSTPPATIRQFQRLLWLLAILPLPMSAGCIVYPDGRPVGEGAANELGRVLGVGPSASPQCGCHSCGDASDIDPVVADESWVAADEITHGDALPCRDGDPSCLGSCAASGDLSQGHSPKCASLQSVGRLPRDAFASTANFCIAPAGAAPPDLPPPGRFHPVPTRPVFAPRDEILPAAAVGF